MRATIDDIHHRHGQRLGIGPANITPKRCALAFRRRFRHRHRNAENGVCAEAGFIIRAVQFQHNAVKVKLLGRVNAA